MLTNKYSKFIFTLIIIALFILITGSNKAFADTMIFDNSDEIANSLKIFSDRTVEDGAYVISCAKNDKLVLDINNSSFSNGGNLLIWSKNGGANQKFYISYEGDGFYKISNINSAKVLDVESAGLENGTNIQQFENNNTNAQKWKINKNVDGTYTFIAKCSGKALDVNWGAFKNGTNIQQWEINNTDAQHFKLEKIDIIDESVVQILKTDNINRAIDISNNSSTDGQAIQLWETNDTMAQRFEIHKVSNDEVRIRTASSGGWLKEKSNFAGSEVVQSGTINTEPSDADTWKISWDNGYTFTNKESGLKLTVFQNSIENGTRIEVNKDRKDNSQRFLIVKKPLLNDGYYNFKTTYGILMDVTYGGVVNRTNIQTWTENGTTAQIFKVQNLGESYKIRAGGSNLVLDIDMDTKGNGTNLQLWEDNGGDNQRFTFEISDGGYIKIRNVYTGFLLNVDQANTFPGANINQYEENGTNAQLWKPIKTELKTGWNYISGQWHYFDTITGQDRWTSNYIHDRIRARTVSITSKTNYYIVMDSDNYRTVIFERNGNDWAPIAEWIGAFGGDGKGNGKGPSMEGLSEVTRKAYESPDGTYFYLTEFRRWSSINDLGQCFHTPTFAPGSFNGMWGNLWDDRLGINITDGCNRLTVENAKWIYDNIPIGTAVFSIHGRYTYNYGNLILSEDHD